MVLFDSTLRLFAGQVMSSSTIAASFSPSAAQVTFDSFACAECGEGYSGVKAGCVPTGLSCGHTLCAVCAEAITLGVPPVCTICKAVVSEECMGIVMLGALCDGVGSDSFVCGGGEGASSCGECVAFCHCLIDVFGCTERALCGVHGRR